MLTHYQKNWALFCAMGLLNNLYYSVIGSAAKDIAIEFGEQKLLGLITWANVGAGLIFRSINTWALEQVPYKYRISAFVIGTTGGLVGLSFSKYIGFWFAILSIVFCGSFSSFGESVVLGYLKSGYPAQIVGGWSTGTGISGIVGSGFYLLAVLIGIPLYAVWVMLIPTVVLYGISFYFLVPEKSEPFIDDQSQKPLLGSYQEPPSDEVSDNQATKPIINDVAVYSINEQQSEYLNETAFERTIRCWKLVFSLANNLFWVYFFEYCISAGWAAKSLAKNHPKSVYKRDSYEFLAFAYQVGVFFARGSLTVFKTTRISLLTIIQGFNFVFWIFLDIYKFIPIGGQIPLMFSVGLLGGAAYVNIFYIILHNEDISEHDRELCTNLTALSITLGISIAGFFILIAFNTFLADY